MITALQQKLRGKFEGVKYVNGYIRDGPYRVYNTKRFTLLIKNLHFKCHSLFCLTCIDYEVKYFWTVIKMSEMTV